MPHLRRLFRTLVLSLLATSFIATTVSPTFCPVTSPAEEQVYVTDTPSKIIIGATLPQCALECGLRETSNRLGAGRQGCRCFNYNSTTLNCSMFMFEPTSYGVDQQGNTIAYQLNDRPIQGLVYWQCKNSGVFVNDRMCARSYDWCQLSSGELAFCWREISPTGLPSNASKHTDCTDISALGGDGTGSGVYTIYVGFGAQQRNISVYCDMTTADSSWTVFQRRMNGSVDFRRPWNDYLNGFGSLIGEFWLGNENLNLLTSAKQYILRIDMSTFDGRTSYAEYDNFNVSSSADSYRLVSIGSYSGTAGDSLLRHLGQQFTTYDMDNDAWPGGNCAVEYKGAWWYERCHSSNLNGYYYGGPHDSDADGVEWKTWTGYRYSLNRTEMKIRPA